MPGQARHPTAPPDHLKLLHQSAQQKGTFFDIIIHSLSDAGVEWAWNKEDNFVPDFANYEQAKWYPFFKYRNGGIRFDSAFVVYATGSVSACFGFRLCFKTRERAEQFGRKFVYLYNQVFLS